MSLETEISWDVSGWGAEKLEDDDVSKKEDSEGPKVKLVCALEVDPSWLIDLSSLKLVEGDVGGT